MRLPAYTPLLYMPDSIGRFRSYGYPRVTVTPIPGAGYPNRRMVWGDQRLNLSGSARRQRYGVGPVPLLGLGGDVTAAGALSVLDSLDVTLRSANPTQGVMDASAQIGNLRIRIAAAAASPASVLPPDLAKQVDAVASKTWWEMPFFGTGVSRSVGIPVLIGGVVTAGLGVWWWRRSRRKAIAANRRRRS